MANGFAFTSFDGPDEDGVRAEVYVQRGTGEVKDIAPHENGKVAQIQIRTEGLRFAQKAWINTDTPQYKAIQEAYENRTPIEYRIESQRKLKNDSTKQAIPRDTPIAQLRENTEIARENTKTLLVGVNGELTDEAVTHPKEDPSQAGRRPAQDPDIAKAAAAPANTAAAPNYTQPRSGATEEPPYKEYNTDGTLNLGSYAVQAAVGAELFVRKAFVAKGVEVDEEEIVRYASISLAIADKIQAYVTKKPRADRMATSHARIRSLVYDVIDNFLPIPDSHAGDEEWVSKVGKLTLARFNASMRIASDPFDLTSLSGSAAPAAKVAPPVKEETPVKEEVPAKVTPPAKETVQKSAPAAKEEVSPLAAEEPPVEEDVPTAGGLLDGATPLIEMFPQTKIEKVTAANKMTEDTLDTFKEFVTESGADFAKLTKLLQHTFGVAKASQVPQAPFEEFLDYYIERGDERFLEVLEFVDTVLMKN